MPTKTKGGWGNNLLKLWTVITVIYTCSAIGFIVPPFSLLTLFIFHFLGFPVPISFIYYPGAQGMAYGGPVMMNAPYYWLLALINIAGVTVSFLAIRGVKTDWTRSYVFVFLSLLSLALAFLNSTLGACNLDAGDGGTYLDKCMYGISTWPGFISSGVLLAIAIGILYFFKKQQAELRREV